MTFSAGRVEIYSSYPKPAPEWRNRGSVVGHPVPYLSGFPLTNCGNDKLLDTAC